MDLTVIKGLGPARREKLEDAGVKTIDDLAEVTVDEVAEDVEVSPSLLSDFRAQAKDLVALRSLEGVGPSNLEKLVEAEVRSLRDLTQRDVDELSEATGIADKRLHRWRRQAGPKAAADAAKATAEAARRSAGQARKAAEELGETARTELADARVVLEEGIADARLMLQDEVLTEIRILPVRAKGEADRVLENVKGNVVVLQEKADTALVRFEDQVYEGVPLFKEKLAEAQGKAEEELSEVRVRVQEIRDKRVIPKVESIKEKVMGLFGRDR